MTDGHGEIETKSRGVPLISVFDSWQKGEVNRINWPDLEGRF